MSLANTSHSFGSVAKILHWLTAILILTLIPLGLLADSAPFDTDVELTRKALLFSLHKTTGVALFFVALLRIIWAFIQPKPGSLNPDRPAEHFMAELAHWLLYGSLVIVPLSGWITHAASEGLAPIWGPFGQSLPFVPKSLPLSENAAFLHWLFVRIMIVTLLAHIAGALKHHVIDRDATLRRMWFGTSDAPKTRGHHISLLPPLGALAIWGTAIGISIAAGSFQHDSHATGPALEQVASDWQVSDGAITIEIQQFGSAVSSEFADWTSAISFDPETGIGDVTTTIAIASLTLGSVTDQAMGPDYFDSDQFPTAEFTADITPYGDSYLATGTLTLKGATISLTLPFDLTLDGATAQMQGETTLNRLDFNIGDQGTTNLGAEVIVTISLSATRVE